MTEIFSRAAVAAPHGAAVEAGRAVLAEGGSATEATVAMAATIAVVYPHMNAIGGDGFWLVREPGGRVRAIEACGPAGALATVRRYRDKGFETIPARGPDAALTVPGTVGGWALALEADRAEAARRGAARPLPLDLLLSDAARRAKEGEPASPSEAREMPKENAALEAAPGYAAAYLVDGKRPAAGAVRRFPALAATLEHLGRAGLDDFYRGDVGREIAADLERLGAPVTRADLAAYRAVEREPLSVRLDGRRGAPATLHNTPPPTQGLASLILLALFERLGGDAAPGGFAHLHALAEATKRAAATRDRVVTDFDRLRHAPAEFLTPRALDREAARIDASRAAALPLRPADGDTIWMGAVDARGQAVSFIQSIYWEYGSGCVLPSTGVLLQNRGASFSLDADAPNPLEPGRKPFHTLNPALAVLDDGRVAPYGSMGGDGQPQFQAQVFSRWRSFGQSPAAALQAPRFLFGRTWGAPSNTLKLEGGHDEGVIRALRSAGHEVEETGGPLADLYGHAGMLVRHPDGRVEAAHDPRADGGAAGL